MSSPSQFRNTPKWKLAAIPLLLAVLVWMVFGRREEEPSTTLAISPSQVVQTQPAGVAQQAAAPGQRPNKQRKWPNFDIAQITASNPFVYGNAAAETAPEQPVEPAESEKKESQSWEVAVYYEWRGNQIALANNRVLRAGDVVDKAWRVTRVTPDQVVLEPLP
jgi:hypothetical protein